MNVDKGEFCFLTGPSGAGKTTFLKLVFREELPSQGQILVGGRNITAIPPGQIPELRRSIGVVFQDFKLLKRKTIIENVAFVLRILGVPPREQKRRAFAALKAVGLHHKMHAYPLQLSGGEQQRVAIARALINEPMLLLADEPTGNLDPEMAQEIMRLFLEVNARGTTVVVATHDREMIQRMGKRVISLEKGASWRERRASGRQHRAHARDHRLERHLVLGALGHDQVGVALRRLDELEVHRAHRVEVLALHGLEAAPALVDVPLQAPQDAHVGVGVDEELDVHQPPQRLLGQHQDPLQDHDRARLQRVGQHAPRVARVVVGEVGDRPAGAQVAQVLHQERGVEGVRVVVVDRGLRGRVRACCRPCSRRPARSAGSGPRRCDRGS